MLYLYDIWLLYGPPLHTVYVYSIPYIILIHIGKVWRGELTREKVRGAIVHKAGLKYQHD